MENQDDGLIRPFSRYVFDAEKGLADSSSSIQHHPCERPGISNPGDPINLTDCHRAMVETIQKARLIGLEIARRNKSFFKRYFKITLSGQNRDFNDYLALIMDQVDYYLDVYIKDIADLEDQISLQRGLITILKTILASDGSFQQHTGNNIRFNVFS
jgi:hypothetical protein